MRKVCVNVTVQDELYLTEIHSFVGEEKDKKLKQEAEKCFWDMCLKYDITDTDIKENGGKKEILRKGFEGFIQNKDETIIEMRISDSYEEF